MKEKAILLGLKRKQKETKNARPIEESMEELKQLVKTAGAEVVDIIIQTKEFPSPAYFFGKGKIYEIKEIIIEKNIDLLICNDNLSPAQKRNIEEIIPVKVIDRVQLILDIFAQRARTKEAKLQVELAQLNYLLPQLTGKGKELSRLGGGIGTRGPGEMKLEYDRRRIQQKIIKIKKQIESVRKHRSLHRNTRKKSFFQTFTIIGYTNAGKSTLLNTLTNTTTLVDNKLFTTLDPLVRKLILPNKQEILLVDTVGFIHYLPANIITAFRATLEEIKEADALLHVIDLSHSRWKEQCKVVYQILEELGIKEKILLSIFNKIDLVENTFFLNHLKQEKKEAVFISCVTKEGTEDLLKKIEEINIEIRAKNLSCEEEHYLSS